jgi:hypothetical protein
MMTTAILFLVLGKIIFAIVVPGRPLLKDSESHVLNFSRVGGFHMQDSGLNLFN